MRRTENRGTRFLHLNRDDAPPFTRLGTWRSVMQEVGGYARVGTGTRAAFRSHVTECMWSSGHGGGGHTAKSTLGKRYDNVVDKKSMSHSRAGTN